MLGTYASFLVIAVASGAVGQALLVTCGWRESPWLAPSLGLAVLAGVAWGSVRLPGEGAAAATAMGALTLLSAWRVRGHLSALRSALAVGIPVAALALLAASLPFLVEGRFGILGTGLNPDMSQHLFAADRLADGEGTRLLGQGYPLGPHALALAASTATGASLVHAFDGLQLAVSVAAALVSLELLGSLDPPRRIVGALLVGLPYLTASYLIQGAFKETMEALFVLAFAIGVHELARRGAGRDPGPSAHGRSLLVALPLSALAIGSVYVYSFPGLLWLAGTAGAWALVELGLAARRDSPAAAGALARRAAPAAGVAVAALIVAVAPEIGRMVEFASFETFNPHGPGLGNLFDPISPLEALGIWPSGDFRLDPGAGAVPAVGFYLGEVVGSVALAYGLVWWLRRGERAVPVALGVAIAVFAYAHFAGTPYQAAKSIVIASPLAMLVSARALISGAPLVELGGLRGAMARHRPGTVGLVSRQEIALRRGLAVAFLGTATGCSVLALVNGPVGPATYSPALTELRHELGTKSTLVLAPTPLLTEEHGRDYIAWELRGARVCVGPAARPSTRPPPTGISWVITQGPFAGPPYAGIRLARRADPYTLWRRHPSPRGNGACPQTSATERASPAR